MPSRIPSGIGEDTDEPVDVDLKSRLLANLAHDCGDRRFPQLDESAGQRRHPAKWVVPPANGDEFAINDDETIDRNRGMLRVGHPFTRLTECGCRGPSRTGWPPRSPRPRVGPPPCQGPSSGHGRSAGPHPRSRPTRRARPHGSNIRSPPRRRCGPPRGPLPPRCSGARSGAASPRSHPTGPACPPSRDRDRKSTRLNSSHRTISYAVFCLKKKKKKKTTKTTSRTITTTAR